MAKSYRVVITAIDSETNAETVEVDDKYTGLTLVADCVGDESRMAEIVLHDNLANMAAKLAAGSKTANAVRLAGLVMDMKKNRFEELEEKLMNVIMGDE